ncbi:hypothetical protein IFM89_002321 [Coptis chinensis]|uniref:Uncharacterized protein n=1 Tax=Coptis chinensis TaxID=261450 RepID=A0A835MCE3_9MAGN|nr:hypothetical protein IFM89_002321 [Coptis chinensis]
MSDTAMSINLVKKFIPLCSSTSCRNSYEVTPLSLRKKLHQINLTNVSNPYPYNFLVYELSDHPEFPRELPKLKLPPTPDEIPDIHPPQEFVPIPPDLIKPIPDKPRSIPDPKVPWPPMPGPKIPPEAPDVEPPRPPDVIPPPRQPEIIPPHRHLICHHHPRI